MLTASLLTGRTFVSAQDAQDNTAIKLYVDPSNLNTLSRSLQERIASKITQLISQTGTAETGYSNFFVVPKFDILSSSVDDAGIMKVYMTECELSLVIQSRSYTKTMGPTIFASWSRRITGSATVNEEALANAINSIGPGDNDLVAFLQQSKTKISAYFQTHCREVVAEADQALALGDYARAISLYFSVPSNAPAACYKSAQDALMKTYKKYVADRCSKQLIQLKAFVARAQSTDATTSTLNYDAVIDIIKDLDPASADCYAEATKQIEKIEKRFDEKQRQEWELKKRSAADQAEIQKETIKAISRISNSYQPPASTVIIAK